MPEITYEDLKEGIYGLLKKEQGKAYNVYELRETFEVEITMILLVLMELHNEHKVLLKGIPEDKDETMRLMYATWSGK